MKGGGVKMVAAACLGMLCRADHYTKPFYEDEPSFHYDAMGDFHSAYMAAKDVGGSHYKAGRFPDILQYAEASRLSGYLPHKASYGTGCLAKTNDDVGLSSLGHYDLLLAQDSKYGMCSPQYVYGADWWGGTNYTELADLPDPAAIWETVLKREGAMIEETETPLNFFFISFVNWFHDDSFRTVHDTNGTYTWTDQASLKMSHVYGHTDDRRNALRTFAGGKMKTSIINGEELPPLYQDIQAVSPNFTMWTPVAGPAHATTALNFTAAEFTTPDATAQYFAMGDPRFNMHPGHIWWATFALRQHNVICDILIAAEPTWSDEKLFQTARLILWHVVQKIRLEQFVGEVAHIRNVAVLHYDPDILRATFQQFLYAGTPNFLEFNHVYQSWHSLIPDNLQLIPETGEASTLALSSLMWNPNYFHENTFADIARGFKQSAISKFGPKNVPQFMKGQAIQSINDARAQRMQPINSYRRAVGMSPFTSFNDFALTEEQAQAMSDLYGGDIEKVEFAVGLFADGRNKLPGNTLGDTQLVYVTLFALQDLANLDIVRDPLLWSEQYLTAAGKQFVIDFELDDYLSTLTGDNIACPMRATEVCTPREDWIDPSDVPYTINAVCSFIGVDLTEWFWDSWYIHHILSSFFLALPLLMILYIMLFAIAHYLMPIPTAVPKNEKVSEKKLFDSKRKMSGGLAKVEEEQPYKDPYEVQLEGVKEEANPNPKGENNLPGLPNENVSENVPGLHHRGSSDWSSMRMMTRGLSQASLRRMQSQASEIMMEDIDSEEDEHTPMVDAHMEELKLHKDGDVTFLKRLKFTVLMSNLLISVVFCGPVTYFWIVLLFKPNWVQMLADGTYFILGWSTTVVGTAFVCEVVMRLAMVRYGGKVFSLVSLHHLGYFWCILVTVASESVFPLKIGMTLLCFWCWEASLYVPFLLIRLFEKNDKLAGHYRRLVLYGFPFSFVIYAVTRLVEIFFLIWLSVCAFQRIVLNEYAIPPEKVAVWLVMPVSWMLIAIQIDAGIGMYKVMLSKTAALRKLDRLHSILDTKIPKKNLNSSGHIETQ